MPVHPNLWARMKREQRANLPDGHIRLGDSIPHGDGVLPVKLFTFRLSSPSKTMIEAVADLYGGTVVPMTRGSDRWQVITPATSLQVIVPQGGLTTWVRRCDGDTIEWKSGRPCLCKAANHQRCEIKTRLSVLLADVPSLGLWLLATKSWTAAANLPQRVAMAEQLGRYTEAQLTIVKGTTLQDGKPVTFVVPHLSIEGQTPRQVLSGSPSAALAKPPASELPPGRPATPELPATTTPTNAPGGTGGAGGTPGLAPKDSAGAQDPASGPVRPDYLAQLAACRTDDDVRALWWQAKRAGHLTDHLAAVLNLVGQSLKQTRQHSTQHGTQAVADATTPAGVSGASGDAAERLAERLRADIIRAWPSTTADLHAAFTAATATSLRRADVHTLQPFLARLLDSQATGFAVDGDDFSVEVVVIDPDDPDELDGS
ncbi:hypothetical protein ACIBH1_44685 [Nonomuraea sp. NPDC050663]|uniref:recombination directionality factor n=1 Tax=Nonomuraea sp. NPDC050663 TaxID=3364370 RepID=UPI0037AEFC73